MLISQQQIGPLGLDNQRKIHLQVLHGIITKIEPQCNSFLKIYTPLLNIRVALQLLKRRDHYHDECYNLRLFSPHG